MVHVLAEDFILRIYVIGTVAARFPKLGSAIKGIFFLGLGKGSLAASEIRTLVPGVRARRMCFFSRRSGCLTTQGVSKNQCNAACECMALFFVINYQSTCGPLLHYGVNSISNCFPQGFGGPRTEKLALPEAATAPR